MKISNDKAQDIYEIFSDGVNEILAIEYSSVSLTDAKYIDLIDELTTKVVHLLSE